MTYEYTEEGAFLADPPEWLSEDEAMYDLISLCGEWHDGQWSAMYSTASTGRINPGYEDRLYMEARSTARYDEAVSDYMLGLLARFGITGREELT